ncbi:Hypothetical predicted protein, partial [Pelobates cultripes]
MPATILVNTSNPSDSVGEWQCTDNGIPQFIVRIDEVAQPSTPIASVSPSTPIPESTTPPFQEGDPIQVRLDSATQVAYDVSYRLVTWHLQLNKWLVSTQYSNCTPFVSVQERAFQWWFYESMLYNVSLRSHHRPRRDILATGLGTYGSVVGSAAQINSEILRYKLASLASHTSTGLDTQYGINTNIVKLQQHQTHVMVDTTEIISDKFHTLVDSVYNFTRDTAWAMLCSQVQ